MCHTIRALALSQPKFFFNQFFNFFFSGEPKSFVTVDRVAATMTTIYFIYTRMIMSSKKTMDLR